MLNGLYIYVYKPKKWLFAYFLEMPVFWLLMDSEWKPWWFFICFPLLKFLNWMWFARVGLWLFAPGGPALFLSSNMITEIGEK